MLKRFSTPKHKEITGSLHKHSLVDTLSSSIVDILGVFSDFSRHIVEFNVFSEILDTILRKFLFVLRQCLNFIFKTLLRHF